MKISPLEFSKKCLANIDYNYLVLFDLNKRYDQTVSTYPEEWGAYYKTQNYQDIDYPIQRKSFIPFGWSENLTKDLSPAQKRIFKEARDFDIYSGLIVPFNSLRHKTVMCLAFDRSEKLTTSKIQNLSLELIFYSQLITTYSELLNQDGVIQDSLLNLFNELEGWQKENMRQKKRRESDIQGIMSDIRTSQMFISHNETRDLSLDTLERAYLDLKRLKG